jgi:hypothetical protein
MLSFVEIDFLQELVQHRRDFRCSPHLCKPTALDNDPDFAAQALDCISEIRWAACPPITVLAREGQQSRPNRSKVRRIERKARQLDMLIRAGTQAFEKREGWPTFD